MGRRLNMVFLATIAIVAMLQSSSAQTDYVVGDALGWVVPPGGATAYTTWAANKTFRVGDTLVFNFATGQHNVARVTKENYNACNTSNPLLLISNGPANVTLSETGEQYFLCAIPGHCRGGQQLAINVSAAASSPAPQPSTPAPQPSSPAPQPATPPPAPTPQPSTPAPAPKTSSPSPIPEPTPAPSTPPSSSPSPATPPSSPTTPPLPIAPSSPSPSGSNDATPPPPPPPSPPSNPATSLGAAGLSTTFLSSIVLAFFV